VTVFLGKLCFGSAVVTGGGAVATYLDPPDPAFDRIALPRSRPSAPGSLTGLCRAARRPVSCPGLVRAASRYLLAVGTVASFQEATAVASNRLAGAQNARNVAGQVLQVAVIRAYAGPLAAAVRAQNAAGRSLAGQLAAAGIDVRLSAAQVERARGALSRVGGMPPVVLARLRNVGLDRALVARALGGGPPAGALDLLALMRRQVPTAALDRFYRATTEADVAALVRSFAAQRLIGTSLTAALNADLAAAQAAPRASARLTALRRFAGRVLRGVPGRPGNLLLVAAEGVAGLDLTRTASP
jgi:hypothetical protein